MAARNKLIGDTGPSDPSRWKVEWRHPEKVHLMISVHADDAAELSRVAERIVSAPDAFIVRAGLDGEGFKGGIVHFGFKDSIAQPQFYGVHGSDDRRDDQPLVELGAMLLGHRTPVENLFWQVPAPNALGHNGSFNAFRVLEQQVAEFEDFLTACADQLQDNPSASESLLPDGVESQWNPPMTRHAALREVVAAKMLGRWRNGVPLAKSPWSPTPEPPIGKKELNNFGYADDPDGQHCPIGSHLRRSNPRDAKTVQRSTNHARRIVRRGIPYGPLYDPKHPVAVERGLLGSFMCASLNSQFEALLYDWTNLGLQDPRITGSNDPVLGNNDPQFSRLSFPVGDEIVTFRGFPRFIHTRGGAYLFQPSISAIRYLASLSDSVGIARVQQNQRERDFDPATLGALTPAYSSMQVLTGDDPAPTDDVFSLACLLYRLVAGHRVFGPRNAAEASSQGMQPQRPQDINDSQWGALKKALSYSRVTRHASIREFTDALQSDTDQTLQLDNDAELIIPVLANEIKVPEIREVPKTRSSVRWVFAVLLIVAVAAGALYRYGMLDPALQAVFEAVNRYSSAVVVSQAPAPPAASTTDTAIALDAVVDEPVELAVAASTLVPMNDTVTAIAEEAPPEPLVDFSLLPAADVEIPFTLGRKAGESFKIALREDSEDVVVDFVRSNGLGVPLVLKLDEVGFSGNRSPWGSRQYSLSDSGVLQFPAGQERSRITLTMASDPLREADQLSTLRLREKDSAESELAVIYVTLEDDDQRAFEAQLPANTIAFAASQASIREADPAVQIDIVRFNPDNKRAVIGYTVHDVTATEGEDYFAPANSSITFGPGQRSARLLIPLVQDTLVEGDEAFVVELSAPVDVEADDVYQRIVVLIRDDEPQYP